MIKKWDVYPKSQQTDLIAQKFNLHPVVADILLRRGICSEAEISLFLNPFLDSLESPFVFLHMQKAVEIIRSVVASGKKILVYGDYDVDGVTASAILFPTLKKLGANVEVYVPHRVQDGYGLNRKSLEPWVKKKVALVITVDNGITSVDAVKYLKDNGICVILVDHHMPKDELPAADAIISAAVNDKKGDPNLAACGLAFKLVWALTGSLEEALQYLDLVTLGTVADLACVLGDNRTLLKHGLSAITKTKNIGLRALMDSAGIHPATLNYRDLAFGLGPRINASGRMGSPWASFKLLTTDNAMEARNLAQILEEGNRDRQRVELSAFQQAAKDVEQTLKPEHRHVLVVESPDWHEGVLGIVAARLVERFKRPAIVISGKKEGIGKGSGRSIPSFSIFNVISQCGDLLETFGGHAQACGLTVRQDRIGALRERLNQLALAQPSKEAPRWVDAELQQDELDLRLVKDLEKLAPFGPGNVAPRFVTRGMRVRGEVKKRGKDTMQCWMTGEKETVTCEVIGFRSYEKWQAFSEKQRPVDILYRPALKNFHGIETLQLELEDWA